MVKKIEQKKIIGRLEYVSFPDFGIENIEAKIDTGAYSGSIHVSSIEEFLDNNQVMLKISLFDKDSKNYKEVILSDFITNYVRSSNGQSEKRYFINSTLKIAGEKFITIFNLSDRSSMRRDVLLGRQNIKNHFLVDVSKTFLGDNN